MTPDLAFAGSPDGREGELRALALRLKAMLEIGRLDARLTASAADAMRDALSSLDHSERARLSGSALEWVAKAVLFRNNPASLIRNGRRRRASEDYIVGTGTPELASLMEISTQSASESIAAAFAVVEFPPRAPGQLEGEVLTARNSATHLDFVEVDASIRALFNSLVYCQALLTHLGTTLSEWIGDDDLLAVANALLAGASDPGLPAGRYEEGLVRIAVATRAWSELQSRIPTELLDPLGRFPRVSSGLNSGDQLIVCPTGGHLAWIEYDSDELSDDQQGGDEDHSNYDVYAGGLGCELCGLELDSGLLESLGYGEVLGTILRGPTASDFFSHDDGLYGRLEADRRQFLRASEDPVVGH